MLKKNSRRGKTAEVTEMNSEFCFVIVALPLSESVGCRHLEEAINNKQEPAITTTRQLVQAGQTKQKGQPVHQLGSRCRLANQKPFTQLRKVPRHCSRYQEAQRGQPKRPETLKGPRGGPLKGLIRVTDGPSFFHFCRSRGLEICFWSIWLNCKTNLWESSYPPFRSKT